MSHFHSKQKKILSQNNAIGYERAYDEGQNEQ